MKTLRPYTLLVLSALTILNPLDAVWAAPPHAFLSEADADGQVSGNLSNSRAGLMTLQGLTGRNELTYGALPWFGLQGNWGDNYQRQDYYTFEGFVPWNLNPGTDYFFSEMGLSVTEQGRLAGNWGLGYGYYLSDWDRLLRTFGYGIVDGQYENTRSGFGLAFENLGKYVDFRGQAFFVASDSVDLVQNSLTGESHFEGNQFCVEGIRMTEVAYHHLDYEVGGPLAYLGDYGISAYGTAYYMFNTQNDDDTFGYGVRGEWSITEDVTFNVNYTHDDVFDDATWFTVSMTTPDGAPRNFARPISVRERFSKSVVRDKRLRTNVEVEEFCAPLLNPKTGSPYVFAHVNPNATDGTGNGTFENPFASIDMMTNNNDPMNPFYNVIYVRPRMDGTAVNLTVMEPDGVAEATTPLLLLPNQLLLGSTIDQPIDTLPQPFLPRSTYTIPALDPGADAPLLMNGSVAASHIVYASRGNLISGFTFDGSGGHNGIGLDYDSMLGPPIGLTPDGVGQDLHVRNNTFQNTVIGVNAPDLSSGLPDPLCSLLGHSTLWNNTFEGNGTGFDVQIDQTNDALPEDPIDGAVLALSIIGNTAEGNGLGGIVTANGPFKLVDLSARDLDGDGESDPVLALNNFLDNAGGGLALHANLGGLMFADVGADPADVTPPPGVPGPFMPSNVFTGNGDFNLQIQATSSDATGNTSAIIGNIIANNFNDPADGGDGLELNAFGDAGTLAFLDFGSTAGSPLVPILSGSNVPLSGLAGVIDFNSFDRENSGFRGVVVDLVDGSADFNFTRNSFVGGNGADGTGLDASFMASPMGAGNANTQLLMTVGGPLAENGNLFNNNGGDGISLSGSGFIGIPPAQLDRSFFMVANNQIINNVERGILIQREQTALFTAVIGDGTPQNGVGNLIQSNDTGILYLSENGSDQAASIGASNAAPFLYFDDNLIDDNALGFAAVLDADSVVQVVGVTNAVTDSGNGLAVLTLNNSAFGLPAQPLTGEDLNNDGIIQPWEDIDFDGDPADTAGPTVLSSVFDSNFVQNFDADGFFMDANDGSFQDVRISGTQLADPGDPNSFIRTFIDGGPANLSNGITINANSTPMVFMPRFNIWTIQGTDVTNVAFDGIEYSSTSGVNILNIGAPFNGTNVTVSGVGNDGLEINSGGVGIDQVNINSLDSSGNGGHGANIFVTKTGLSAFSFNLTDSMFNNNGLTGFTADNRQTAPISIYNIGTEERDIANATLDGTNEDANGNGLLDPAEDTNGNGILDSGEDVNNDSMLGFAGNEFSGNNHQGFFFQTLSPLTGDTNIAGTFASPDALAPNAPQNIQGTDDVGDIFYTIAGIDELGLYANPGSTSVNVFSRLNFYHNQVVANGTPITMADGMVLSVGTNTTMAASIDGNMFGANTLDDVNIITVVSQDPLDSVANGAAADTIRYDPVSFLALAFGENFTVGGNNAPLPFPIDSPNMPGVGNTGDSIAISPIGVDSSVIGRTEVGVFRNSDPVKPADRNALGFWAIYVGGGPADIDFSNVFSQQPSLQTVIGNSQVTIPARFTTAGNPIGPLFTTPFYTGVTWP